MTPGSTFLAGDPSRRRITGTASSALGSGLRPARLFEHLAPQPGPVIKSGGGQSSSLELRLYSALADAKVWTAQVVMRMGLEERNRYFHQLDLIHHIEEWHGNDSPLRLDSYQGFIRFMLTLPGKSKPSLGLTPKGALLAVWQKGQDRLTVEFLDREHVEWVVSRREAGEVERAAGKTLSSRLLANLAPYQPQEWFAA